MPQLTLFGNGANKSLSLSPQKPTTSSATRSSASPSSSRARAYTKRGDEPNLWELHHIQEDMAGINKARSAKKAKDEPGANTEAGAKAGSGSRAEAEAQDAVDAQGAGSGQKKEVKKGIAKGKKDKAGDENGENGQHMDEGEERGKGAPGPAGKRERSPEGGGVAGPEAKRHKNAYEIKGRIATAEDAARADEDTPLEQLMRLQQNKDKKGVEKGESVVYWMRMEDMRVEDNTALATASECAKKLGLPLVMLFVLSPGDYHWHDRSPRRIDFMLRNLKHLKPTLDSLNIPLHVVSYPKRLSIPRKLVNEVFPFLRANHVFANIEYEVDELRRDIATTKLGREKGIDVVCVHDRLVVPPGRITSQKGTPMAVFSPWQRAWAKLLDKEPSLLETSSTPDGNQPDIRQHDFFGKLFDAAPIPDEVEGFKCEDREQMEECWPEGIERAKELLQRFLYTKPRKSQFHLVSPLTDGAEEDKKNSRVNQYQTGRNLVDADNSSRLSPYLTSGVISGRMVLQEARKVTKGRLESGRDSGVGMWVQEVSWRDFYNHVMATWPRISMGRPFLEKFADVQWEVSEEHLQAWKDGKTGYPIVDAAMRACAKRGWMENRVRMVTACFLVKDLMLDWRLGEKYFMQSFIDGDLAANNGGWQWTASTGTDPQPYFRIFNTLTQSEKCDPNGDYIRYWLPELKHLKGKAIHDPFHNMPSGEFKKLGYPPPIVDHKKARERALFRYKNVGEKETD